MDIKHTQTQAIQDSSTNVFLAGAILFAGMDYTGLAECTFQAVIGGLSWMTFKLANDLIIRAVKRNRENNSLSKTEPRK